MKRHPRMKRRPFLERRAWLAAGVLLLGLQVPLSAQGHYGFRLGSRIGEGLNYRPSGVAIYANALDPTIQRWYLPAVAFSEQGRKQWEYLNYARERQQRYISAGLEGDNYYDLYGDLITRGWLVYEWSQKQPVIVGGSTVLQTSRYTGVFDRLVIASDVSGGRGYSITVGDEIATTLTPMTLHKAGFNGFVSSYMADRFRATGIASRISDPVLIGSSVASHFTTLMGGRALVDVTDFLTVGLTYINTHDNTTTRDAFDGNPYKGFLNEEELSVPVELLVLRLTDDSPEDGEGGVVLFSDDIEITTTILRPDPTSEDPANPVMMAVDTLILGSDVGFRPLTEGGELEGGFLTASGAEQIVLKYPLVPTPGVDVTDLSMLLQQHLDLSSEEAADVISLIRDVRFRLVLANDYRVEMTSNRQTDSSGIPQFRLVTQADGNVKNQLNQREVVFDYGLPTANQIVGITTEIRDFHGIDFYGEANLNTQYRKYPGISRVENGKLSPRDKHRAITGIQGDKHAVGWMVNASWRSGPWSVYAEGFGMDDEYTTSVRPVRAEGLTDYDPDMTQVQYDYVDDNDDNDRHPDQLRIGEASLIPDPLDPSRSIFHTGRTDPEVFPGYDENQDFISDFNQNSIWDRQDFYPDYDEPFLRYRVDRPEFLFGIDLNNNGWVERFENDDEPDYPYKKDHWGHNVYGGVEIVPGAEARVGQLRQEMNKNDRENKTTYGILSVEHSRPWGRVRAFDMLKKAEDTIPDDLVQWTIPRAELGQASLSPGRLEQVEDALAAEDTWINTLYGDYEYESPRGWATFHRFKWERWRQRETDVTYQVDADGNQVLDADGEPIVLFDPLGPKNRNGRETSGFVGLINKAEYSHQLGSVRINPRLKSEYLKESPFSLDLAKRKSWDAIFFFLLRFPVLRTTEVQTGFEQRYFHNLRGDEDDLVAGALTGDFRGSALAIQLTNRGEYLGYQLTAQAGMRIDRRSLEVAAGDRQSITSGLTFLSIFAGLD